MDPVAACDQLLDEILGELLSGVKTGDVHGMEAWRQQVGPIHDRLANESCPLLDVEELRQLARDRWREDNGRGEQGRADRGDCGEGHKEHGRDERSDHSAAPAPASV